MQAVGIEFIGQIAVLSALVKHAGEKELAFRLGGRQQLRSEFDYD